MNTRSKWFMVVIEKNDQLNNIEFTKEMIKDYCSQDAILYYSFILHNLDYDSNGKIKTPHYHIVIRTYNDYSCKTIIKDVATFFKCNREVISCRVCKDVCASNRYLLHLDDHDKTEYHIDDLVSSSLETYDNLCVYGDLTQIDFDGLNEIINNSKSLTEIYSQLPLSISVRYRNLIYDMYNEKKGKKKDEKTKIV